MLPQFDIMTIEALEDKGSYERICSKSMIGKILISFFPSGCFFCQNRSMDIFVQLYSPAKSLVISYKIYIINRLPLTELIIKVLNRCITICFQAYKTSFNVNFSSECIQLNNKRLNPMIEHISVVIFRKKHITFSVPLQSKACKSFLLVNYGLVVNTIVTGIGLLL